MFQYDPEVARLLAEDRHNRYVDAAARERQLASGSTTQPKPAVRWLAGTRRALLAVLARVPSPLRGSARLNADARRTSRMERRLLPVDPLTLKAGLLGSNPDGLFKL